MRRYTVKVGPQQYQTPAIGEIIIEADDVNVEFFGEGEHLEFALIFLKNVDEENGITVALVPFNLVLGVTSVELPPGKF